MLTADGGRRGVFLDRDGTISEEVGFVNDIGRFRLIARSAAAIRRLNDANMPVLVATSQSGIARGLFDEALLQEVHETMKSLLAAEGARVDGIYVCPHHPSDGPPPWRRDCDCRKPRPGLLLRGARDHGLALAGSYMIGDKAVDIETAHNAGTTGILVLTGYGRGEMRYRIPHIDVTPAHVADDLFDAVEWILRREEKQ